MPELPKALDLFPDPRQEGLPKAADLFPDAPPTQEVELKSEEKPAIPVGAKAFDVAAHAARPGLDFLGGAYQHGAALLQKLGVPIDAGKAAANRDEMMKGFDEFVQKSMKSYGHKEGDFPHLEMVGDVAGQLLLYGSTGPAFMETAFGKAMLAGRPIIKNMLMGAAQGATIEGLSAKGEEDVGTQTFYGALGGAFGGGVAGLTSVGVSKVANSFAIKRIAAAAKDASASWEKDGQALANAFSQKSASLIHTSNTESARAGNLLLTHGLSPDIHAPLPSNAPQAVKDAVQRALDAEKNTEFLTSNIFKPVEKAAGSTAGGSATTWQQANKRVIDLAMGDDKVNIEKLYKAMTPNGRIEIQKGMLYRALEKASVEGTHKYDPVKLKEALDTSGIDTFFSGKDKEVLKGFQNIVGEGSNILGHHPYLVAHGLSGLAGAVVGGAEGYRHGNAYEGATAGFLTYLTAVTMVSKLAGSQTGRNLMAAAARTEPGTPTMAKIYNKAAMLVGPALATMPLQNSNREITVTGQYENQ